MRSNHLAEVVGVGVDAGVGLFADHGQDKIYEERVEQSVKAYPELGQEKPFNSKILLFGEYSIIQNSWALSLPYPLFSGKLLFKTQDQDPMSFQPGNRELLAFGDYLKDLLGSHEQNFHFDINAFLFDIAQGLTFHSTIPMGFGVGSSGALCAALFHRYGELKKNAALLSLSSTHGDEEKIKELRDIFSKMESHFHGKSSGIDPLISYLNQPILIRSKNDLGIVEIPKCFTCPDSNEFFQGEKKKGAIFLLNTGRPRRTEPLVNLFLEMCKKKEFQQKCSQQFIPITNQCISHFLAGELSALFESFADLSRFQYEYLLKMIPPTFHKVWAQGLQHNRYNLKLCGAGGGGFLLGITADFEQTSQELAAHQLRTIFTF